MRLAPVIAVLALCSKTAVSAAQHIEEWGAVDMQPVLRVEDMHVSAYLAIKHVKRHVQWKTDDERPIADAAVFEEWRKHFVAQHVIIADLMRRGQGDIPEVRTAVEVMERHMLTDPSGPFYECLVREAMSEIDMEREYSRAGTVIDGVLVRFKDRRRLRAWFTPELKSQGLDSQIESLRALGSSAAVDIHDGKIFWADAQSYGIFDDIYSAPVGQWSFVEGRYNGDFAIYVRGRSLTQSSPFEGSRKLGFIAAMKYFTLKNLREQRRASILEQAHPLPNEGVAPQLLASADLQEAKASGITATPRFREDRENFRRFTALGRYRREVLLPEVQVGDAEIAAEVARGAPASGEPSAGEGLRAAIRDRLMAEKLAEKELEIAESLSASMRVESAIDEAFHQKLISELEEELEP